MSHAFSKNESPTLGASNLFPRLDLKKVRSSDPQQATPRSRPGSRPVEPTPRYSDGSRSIPGLQESNFSGKRRVSAGSRACGRMRPPLLAVSRGSDVPKLLPTRASRPSVESPAAAHVGC
eukprot:763588-Hanusia_phi.AAC.6